MNHYTKKNNNLFKYYNKRYTSSIMTMILIVIILNVASHYILQAQLDNLFMTKIDTASNETSSEHAEEIKQQLETLMTMMHIIITLIMLGFSLYIFRVRSMDRIMITNLAYLDDVTGSLNKNSFKLESTALIENSKHPYALLMLDINKFKIINDIYSYKLGDALLKHISNVLTTNLKPHERYARIEGDKFYILAEFTTKEQLERRFQDIAHHISQFRFVGDSFYHIVVNVGVYMIDHHDMPIDSIIDRAILANKAARGYHDSTLYFYHEDILNQLLEHSEMENDMQAAIDNKDFQVYLQPKYDIQTDNIAGAEALIRWQHPKKGLISPDNFIALFETNGFVTKIDMFALEEVCKYQRKWIDEGYAPYPISINQSRLHLYNPNYLDELLAIIKKYHLDPHFFELELTESTMFENMDLLIHVMKKLHAADFKLSIDDFGSGYSSLNLLKDLIVDTIKIDRGFFNDSVNDARSKLITKQIIHLSKLLKMQVVAEGVETKQQIDFLRNTGCDLVQGYYYSKPIPIADFYEKLQQQLQQ